MKRFMNSDQSAPAIFSHTDYIDKSGCRNYVICVLRPIPKQLQVFLIKKEIIMIEVTQSATQQIAEYFKDKTVAPIRIFLNAGG
jgi:hypothetical protein